MQYEAIFKEMVMGSVNEMLNPCDCDDPGCQRNFRGCGNSIEFLNKLKGTVSFISKQRAYMIGEVCQAVCSNDVEERHRVAKKVHEQGPTATTLHAAVDLVTIAIMLTPQQGTGDEYRASLLAKCEELAERSLQVELAVVDDVEEVSKYELN